MPIGRLSLGCGLLGVLLAAGPIPGWAQSIEPSQANLPQAVERGSEALPESTVMAILATSLVGLCLAGLQKRRKG